MRDVGGAGDVGEGEEPPWPRRIRLRELAAAAGVSVAQASHALTGYADVAPATRERIQRLADSLGYRPSARARSLRSGRMATWRCGVVLVEVNVSTFGRIDIYGPVLAGMLGQARTEQVVAQVIALPPEDIAAQGGMPAAMRRLVNEDRADGFLLFVTRLLQPEDIAPFVRAQVPFVLVNWHMGDFAVDAVTVDYQAGIEAAVDHLAALGHRRLALLLRDRPASPVEDRRRGWIEATERAGIPSEDAPVQMFTGDFREGGYRLAKGLLSAPEEKRVTAFVCHTDVAAHGVLRAAREARLRVPEDVSVLGFENMVGTFFTPPLCTFESSPHQMGIRAMALLAERLRTGPGTPRRVMITPEFVCRESCGAAPRG